MNPIQKTSQLYRETGFFRTLKIILKKASQVFVDTNSATWFEKDLRKEITAMPAPEGIKLNFSSMAETINWLKENEKTCVYNKNEVITALKNGHYYPNVTFNGKIIGFIKIAKNEVYLEDYRKIIKLEDKKAFFYDIYILPDYRNKNLATFVANESAGHLKKEGFEKIGLHIPDWNKASISVALKNGFKQTEYIKHIRIFGLIKIWLSKNLKTNG